MNTETETSTGTVSGESTLVGRGLRKSYGDFEAVKGVDFQVSGGECFGFLGPNGAGKTTTMKMIYGAVIRTGGELEVAGLDVRDHEREIKRRIGVVPQEDNLDEELRVRENLLIYGRYYDLPRKVILRRADELLDFMQLSEKVDARVEQLSGGMKRRLLIARALINDPELVVEVVLLGDDPNAAFDLPLVMVDVEAGDGELSARRYYGPVDHLHRRRLPCPVRAQEPETLSTEDLEVDTLDCLEARVDLLQTSRLKGGLPR